MPKVAQFRSHGGPAVLEIIEAEERDPGYGEVRIKVEAIGVNRVEAMYRSGQFGDPALPSRLGYEATGIVDALGPSVNLFVVGDRVTTIPGQSMEQYGTYGTSILYPATELVRVPATLSSIDAAASWMQYLTAYGLIGLAGMTRGDHVIITAASSSVGIAAIQIANLVGATAIATTRNEEKAELLKRLGAAHVSFGGEARLVETVMDATDGRGARIAFDAVGGSYVSKLMEAMAVGGTLLAYGTLTDDSATISVSLAMQRDLTLRGYAMNHILNDTELRAGALDFVETSLQSGALRPLIDRIFPFAEIVEAHQYLESNRQIGKIVVAIEQ